MNGRQTADEVQRGIMHEKELSSAMGCVLSEVLLLSIGLGVSFHSWWAFGGSLVGLFILLSISTALKPLAILFTIAISLFWGYLGYSIGQMIGTIAGSPQEAAIVIGILCLLFSLGIHAMFYDTMPKSVAHTRA